jgi:branched-chain amino acid transport system permease protein
VITVTLIIEQLVNGLASGCMYAIIASGLTLIWGTMKMLNFAHGEFYMLGGYSLFFASTSLGVPLYLCFFITVAAVFFFGVIAERLIIHPLLDRPGWELSPLVVTVGASIFLQNLALRLWGERYKNVPYFFDGTQEVLGFRMANQRIFIFIVTALVMFGFWIFIKKSKFGFALRATAQERDSALLVGINVRKIYTLTFGISCALAAVAAVLLAPIHSVNPWMGANAVLKGFITVVLGGLGSFGGAIIGGMILGIAESVAVIVFSSEWKDVVSFGIFILVLIFKPAGLFGTKEW